jgi:hypothetical protein
LCRRLSLRILLHILKNLFQRLAPLLFDGLARRLRLLPLGRSSSDSDAARCRQKKNKATYPGISFERLHVASS